MCIRDSIHMDPVITGSKELTEIKETVTGILKDIDEVITMHDFRMVQGPTHTNLIFDVAVSYTHLKCTLNRSRSTF